MRPVGRRALLGALAAGLATGASSRVLRADPPAPPPRRLVLVMQNNGTQQGSFWPRQGFLPSPILEPLLGEPALARRTAVVKGIYFPHDTFGTDGNEHDIGFARMFTGHGLVSIGGHPWGGGPSVDQLVARAWGTTPLTLAVLASAVEPFPKPGFQHRRSLSYLRAGVHQLLVPLASLAAARRARLDLAAFAPLAAEGFPPHVYAFAREAETPGRQLHARMFFEAGGVREDPATGSATACLGAYLLAHAHLGERFSLEIEQGVELGRPSLLRLEVTGPAGEAAQQLAATVAEHIAAGVPQVPVSVDRSGVSAELIERERAIFIEQAKESGKPEEIAKKMTEGRINKLYGEITLLEQPWVRDDKQTIQQLVKAAGAGYAITRFARFQMGEA